MSDSSVNVYVYVVISNRIYDGDTLYGVFTDLSSAMKSTYSTDDDDLEIRKLLLNQPYRNGETVWHRGRNDLG